MKREAIGIFATFLILLASLSFADEVQIPFSCYPLELQVEFAKAGMKLDLRAEDRTDDSWGYLQSEGNSFKLFSYHALQPVEFQTMQDIIFKIADEKAKQ